MKRLVTVLLFLIIMFIVIGCATTTPEQRKETYDLRSSVGNETFVGDTSGQARNFNCMASFTGCSTSPW